MFQTRGLLQDILRGTHSHRCGSRTHMFVFCRLTPHELARHNPNGSLVSCVTSGCLRGRVFCWLSSQLPRMEVATSNLAASAKSVSRSVVFCGVVGPLQLAHSFLGMNKGCRHCLVRVVGSTSALLTLTASVRSCRYFAGKTLRSYGADRATLAMKFQ